MSQNRVMRLITVTLPAGLALACAGGLMMLHAQDGKQETAGDLKALGLSSNEPRHPVTPQMEQETKAQNLKPAPPMTVEDARGGKHDLGGISRPQFLLFIVDGCPCSVDAQPIMGKLYKHFDGAIEFLGVTNGDKAAANDWWVRYSVPFPIIQDEKKTIIHAYQAKHSVYSALLKDGKIVKMWPGYSVAMLKEMNHLMAQEARVPEQPFDPEYAPQAKTSGCAF